MPRRRLCAHPDSSASSRSRAHGPVGAARLLLGRDRDDRDRGDLQRRARLPAAGVAQRAHGAHGDDRSACGDVRGARRVDAPRWHRPARRSRRRSRSWPITASAPGRCMCYVQAATALVLLLAANTAFNGFPRMLSFMARNGHAPRVCLRLGDRLAFSNGTIALAIAAAMLFAVFAGRTDALIPLYAVGVFVAFTFSQAGMVVHWWRRREEHWRKSMVLNALGAALSADRLRDRRGDQVQPGGVGRAALDRAARARSPGASACHYDSVRRAARSASARRAPRRAIRSCPRARVRLRSRPLARCATVGGGRESRPAPASGGRADRPSRSGEPARTRLCRLAGPAGAGGAHQPRARTRPDASSATGRRGAITCHSRSSTRPTARLSRRWRATSTRCAPSAPTHADRRPARAHRQAPLAPAVAQRHRAPAATCAASPAGGGHHHRASSSVDLTATARPKKPPNVDASNVLAPAQLGPARP